MTGEASVRAAIDAYIAKFSAGDFEGAAAEHIAFPLSQPNGGGVTLQPDAAAYIASSTALMNGLRDQRYSHTVYTGYGIVLLGMGTALVSVNYDRMRQDGSLLRRASALYTLIEVEGAWRIAVMAPCTPDVVARLG